MYRLGPRIAASAKQNPMKPWLSILLFLSGVGLPANAGEKVAVKPNALTPKEVAEGWLLLFDGTTTFGWNVDGDAKVQDGVLVLGGYDETRARLTTGLGSCEFRMEYRIDGKASM